MPSLNLAVRITLPFADASGCVHAWALKAEKLLCYEHLGSETEKVHVHLLLIGATVTTERLKQLSGLRGSGNEFWSFKTKSKAHGPITTKNADRYITYMSKGIHDPKYVKGYDLKVLQACKEAWEERENVANPGRVLLSEFREYLCFVREPGFFVLRLHPDGEEYETWDPMAGKLFALYARKWAFSKYDCVWSVQTAKIAKQVYLTFCMDMGIEIPQDVKVW